MRRIGRIILIALAALSLLLCAAATALWVRSGPACEQFALGHDRWQDATQYRAAWLTVGSYRGRIVFNYNSWGNDFRYAGELTAFAGATDAAKYRRQNPGETRVLHRLAPMPPGWTDPAEWHGFAWARQSSWSRAQWEASRRLLLPAWAVVLATLILPAQQLREYFRRRRRVGPGVCLACHYDLTANQSGVCPECGTIVAKRNA